MISTRHFNIQLLCAVLVIAMSTSHAAPTPFKRFSSATPSPNPTAQNWTQRSTVTLDEATNKQLDSIFNRICLIQQHTEKGIRVRNKIIGAQLLILSALGAYYVDQYQTEITHYLNKALEMMPSFKNTKTTAEKTAQPNADESETTK